MNNDIENDKIYDLKSLVEIARKNKGLSQRQLAKAVNSHHSTINDIERGKTKNINADLLVRISKELEIDLKVLLRAAGYIQLVDMVKKQDPYKRKPKSKLKELLSDYKNSQLDLLEFDTRKREIVAQCRGRLTSLELKLNDYDTFKSLWTIDKIKQEIKEINDELDACCEKYDYAKLPRND